MSDRLKNQTYTSLLLRMGKLPLFRHAKKFKQVAVKSRFYEFENFKGHIMALSKHQFIIEEHPK